MYRRIIAEEAGKWALPVRGLLRAAEAVYARGVALRNAHYDRKGPRHIMEVPVISVGNLTVGGTGKTPFVIELVCRLERMGLRPAVVSRGYKAAGDGLGDEERLIRSRCPSVVYVSKANRALAAQIASRRFGVDVIVLDDGFQHRRLGRCLDIVLVDATCPFGYGHLLPRGLLREPVDSLRRSHMVVLTRVDQVSPSELTRIEACVRRLADQVTILKCKHRVTSIERLGSVAPAAAAAPCGSRSSSTSTTGGGRYGRWSTGESLERKRAVLFAGIGRPPAFTMTVRSMGVTVVGERWWPDHHRYRRRDIDSLLKAGRFPPHDLLLTTEKDAVKLTALGGFDEAEIFVVKVAIDFVGESGTMLQQVLDQTLKSQKVKKSKF